MKSRKSFCEAIVRIISIHQRNIDNFLTRRKELHSRLCQSAIPDIFTYGKTAQHGKCFLKISGRHINMRRDILN